MHTAVPSSSVSTKTLWAGRVLSALPVLILIPSGIFTLFKAPSVVQGFAHFGYPESTLFWVAIAEVLCAVLYLIPRTAVLGAIVMTGYLGGAIATHVRIGEAAWVIAFTFAVFAWGGLYLREPRLRALLPLRR